MTKVLIPSGALGLNYDNEALARGLAAKPDTIAIDGGSTDSGPAYLGRGVSKYSRASTKREWQGLMIARAEAGVPLVIGTSGTCGTDSTVNWMFDITAEIAAELGQKLKIAKVYSEQSADHLATVWDRIKPLPVAPDMDAESLQECTHIVALAGAEQIQAAIKTGADIIIAGRTTDTAIIAALPLMHNDHAGAAWHGAKIGECGALCASNPQSGVILIDFDHEGFTVTPLADGAHASPHTVSAHMLYENADPFILLEPGGHLDVRDATYSAIDDTSVRVTGSRWYPSSDYTVKLEGARIAGYQMVSIALLRDQHYVKHAQIWADDIQQKCAQKIRQRLGTEDFTLELRLIGQNASFGALEARDDLPLEIGVMGLITAPDPTIVEEMSKILDPYLLHHPLTQQEEQPTFAFPFSPAGIARGAVYSFCLNHVWHLDEMMQPFRLEVENIG